MLLAWFMDVIGNITYLSANIALQEDLYSMKGWL